MNGFQNIVNLKKKNYYFQIFKIYVGEVANLRYTAAMQLAERHLCRR